MVGDRCRPWNAMFVVRRGCIIIHIKVCFQAYYVFWAEIGRRMGMQDVPESLEEMKAWSAVRILEKYASRTRLNT
jgi:hypothetical protein